MDALKEWRTAMDVGGLVLPQAICERYSCQLQFLGDAIAQCAEGENSNKAAGYRLQPRTPSPYRNSSPGGRK